MKPPTCDAPGAPPFPGAYYDEEMRVWLRPENESPDPPKPKQRERPAKQRTRPRLWKEHYSVEREGYYMTFPFRLISLLPAMPPLHMAAYLYLRREAHNRKLPGFCLVSHPMLATALGISLRSAKWVTSELRQAGLVVLDRRGSSTDGGHANVYRVPPVTTEVMKQAAKHYGTRQVAAEPQGRTLHSETVQNAA